MTEFDTQQPTGYDLLHNPRLNKGTSFTEAERREHGLEGLLAPAVTTIDLQIARRRSEIANLADDLQRYIWPLRSTTKGARSRHRARWVTTRW